MLCSLNICFRYTVPQASSFKHKPCINKVALPLLYERPDADGLAACAKEGANEITIQTSRVLPSFSVSSNIGESFTKWLTG